jgi:hypothetical protein
VLAGPFDRIIGKVNVVDCACASIGAIAARATDAAVRKDFFMILTQIVTTMVVNSTSILIMRRRQFAANRVFWLGKSKEPMLNTPYGMFANRPNGGERSRAG